MPKKSESDIYSAARNPPRLAKSDLVSLFPTILPMKPYTPRQTTTTTTTTTAADNDAPAEAPPPPPPPAKRGRKPGPLSRAAREAQRRLNHSIIEKARRTKINEALATLKRLVPADYGQQQQKQPPAAQGGGDEDSEEEDDEYEVAEGSQKSKAKPKSKATGKKEEKEKEFKLEILVRTVSFLQDLLERVDTMETTAAAAAAVAQPSTCQNCAEHKKRKRTSGEREDVDVREDTKRPRISSSSSNATLPSISSWLHESDDQRQVHHAHDPTSSPTTQSQSYLPSPPSSTHFDPVRSSTVPPLLSLGPVATAALVTPSSSSSNSARTPEDESAASSLLQIASSPPFLPTLPGVTTTTTSSSSSVLMPKFTLSDPPNFLLHGQQHREREYSTKQAQAQTPSSILGLSRRLF